MVLFFENMDSAFGITGYNESVIGLWGVQRYGLVIGGEMIVPVQFARANIECSEAVLDYIWLKSPPLLGNESILIRAFS